MVFGFRYVELDGCFAGMGLYVVVEEVYKVGRDGPGGNIDDELFCEVLLCYFGQVDSVEAAFEFAPPL